jgi:hypothetical protein
MANRCAPDERHQEKPCPRELDRRRFSAIEMVFNFATFAAFSVATAETNLQLRPGGCTHQGRGCSLAADLGGAVLFHSAIQNAPQAGRASLQAIVLAISSPARTPSATPCPA